MITHFVEIFVVLQKDRKMNMIMLREKNRTMLHINTHLTNTLQPSKKVYIARLNEEVWEGAPYQILVWHYDVGKTTAGSYF